MCLRIIDDENLRLSQEEFLREVSNEGSSDERDLGHSQLAAFFSSLSDIFYNGSHRRFDKIWGNNNHGQQAYQEPVVVIRTPCLGS